MAWPTPPTEPTTLARVPAQLICDRLTLVGISRDCSLCWHICCGALAIRRCPERIPASAHRRNAGELSASHRLATPLRHRATLLSGIPTLLSSPPCSCGRQWISTGQAESRLTSSKVDPTTSPDKSYTTIGAKAHSTPTYAHCEPGRSERRFPHRHPQHWRTQCPPERRVPLQSAPTKVSRNARPCSTLVAHSRSGAMNCDRRIEQ